MMSFIDMKFLMAILLLIYSFDNVHLQINLSSYGKASQSTTYTWASINLTADLAITGGPTNDFSSKSCSVTDLGRNVAWWMLTFSEKTYVTIVNILYRIDTPHRLAGYYLFISNSSYPIPNSHLCHHDEGPNIPPVNQTVECYRLGQHIIFYNNRTGVIPPGYGNEAVIELCDVQVYGCNKTWYGKNCDLRCSSKCIEQQCYPGNGSCVWGCNCIRNTCNNDSYCTDGCKGGYAGLYCMEYNAATNKTSLLLSSTLNQNPKFGIDGNRTKTSCLRTNGTNTWYQVDLNSLHVIHSIHLTFDLDDNVKSIYGNHAVYVTNTSSSWVNASPLSVNSSYSFPLFVYDLAPTIGQFVIFVPAASKDGKHYVDLCEIEVIGCPPTRYGSLCEKDCPTNCEYCDAETGQCVFGCKNGWQGPYCTETCSSGSFGNKCSGICHCVNQPCNNIDGHCLSGECQPGYKDSNCSIECPRGSYGANCLGLCAGCLFNSCDKLVGVCTDNTGCKPGFQRGYLKCDKECDYGTFGYNCVGNCSTCKNNACENVEGNCMYGCVDGYYGDRCHLSVSTQSENNSGNQIIYAVVGTFVVTVVLGTTVYLLIKRIRRCCQKRTPETRNGQYANPTFSSQIMEQNYGKNMPASDEQPYDVIGGLEAK